MAAALFHPTYEESGVPLRQRGLSLLLVAALHILLLLLLLRLAPPSDLPEFIRSTATRVKLIGADPAPAATNAAKAERTKSAAAPEAARLPVTPVLPPPAPVPPTLPTTSGIWSKVVPLTRQEMASGDIAAIPSRPKAAEQGPDEAESGSGSGDTPTVGTAPNGEPLYQAEWYREPREAELSTYLPARRPRSGWGLIACQTAPAYRVENCRELGQSPAGSGLAGAVRQAAWQFRVRPPRKGGRPLIGAWVRIRIDYAQREVEAPAETPFP